ncbi:nucleotidyl transferase AbiEii/AbiGii toxin family protein [Streptomyces uncialis]|uniref:nucleotidyl transferase AbiEii/AbiGii toxin family protein n=1 Tax=Streptomyces uncialis TaxID=1048205 RepID=UPI00386EDF6D|nr:nucleotidyl transferase AbiEii/AbiGii toxin family protein [Streptomyces uncialis]
MNGAEGRHAWQPADWTGLTSSTRHPLHCVAGVLCGVSRLLPEGRWHLKGSTALLGWTGPTARLPDDVDLSVAQDVADLLLTAGELPGGAAGERLRLLRAEPMVFSTGGRAPVHRALVRVDGPEVSGEVLLNVAPRPVAEVAADRRTAPLSFPLPGGGTVVVPAATFGRCLAQKLLRYTLRRSGDRRNTRWSDLLDFLSAASAPRAPVLTLGVLRRDVAAELAVVGRAWPDLPVPPAEWLDHWDSAVFRSGLPFGRLPDAAERAARFWRPVLSAPPGAAPVPGTEAPYAPERVWNFSEWRWQAP